VIALVLLVSAATVRGGESFPETQYVSGKAGLARKIEGTLIIGQREIRFADKQGRPVFRIRMEDVLRASPTTESREYPLSAKTREYVRVEAKSGETTETIVFRTARHRSAALAAKIEFFREKAVAAPP